MSHAARRWASGIPTCAPNIEVGGSGLGGEGGAELFGAAGEVLAERDHGVDALLAPEPAPPAVVERAPGGEDGLLHLRERQRLDFRDDLFGVRVLDREGLTVAGDESPVDVRLPDVGDLR